MICKELTSKSTLSSDKIWLLCFSCSSSFSRLPHFSSNTRSSVFTAFLSVFSFSIWSSSPLREATVKQGTHCITTQFTTKFHARLSEMYQLYPIEWSVPPLLENFKTKIHRVLAKYQHISLGEFTRARTSWMHALLRVSAAAWNVRTRV